MMLTELLTTARCLAAPTARKIRPRPAMALGALAATATLSAGLAGAPLAKASVTSASPAGVITHRVQASGPSLAWAAHTRAFWTRDRMLSARSADILSGKPGAAVSPGAHAAKPEITGAPGRVAGVLPTQRLVAGTRSVLGAHGATPADGASGASWYGPANQPPAATTGKVFFTTTAGGQTQYWQCSGSTVNSAGKDTVVTAGHCVYGSGGGEVPGEGWHTNWVFVPGYNNGNSPYGIWTASQLGTVANYYNNGGSLADEGDDIGVAVMSTNSAGQHIVNVVGGQGYEWNYPYQYVSDFGYPAAPPFTGEVLDYCTGREFDESSIEPNNMGLDSDFTGGSSGGPWLASFNGEFGYINGVNDWKTSAAPGVMLAAYFGTNFINLYNAVADQ